MTLLTIFNAVMPMPTLLHRYGGGSNPKSAIAVCASIAIVGIFLMLLSFAYFTVKSYFKHKKNRLTLMVKRFYVACLKGFEPLTLWFVAKYSSGLSYKHIFSNA